MMPQAFILCTGRSGSTLLKNILNSHSKVLGVPESHFLILFGLKYAKKKSLSKTDLEIIIGNLWLREPAMKNIWNIDEKELLQTILRDSPKSFGNVLQSIYCSYGFGSHKKDELDLLVDKFPFQTNYLSLIDRVFSKSKKVILVRDYTDRYISILDYKSKKYSSSKIVRGIAWQRANAKLYRYHQQNPNTSIVVKYEALVTDSTKEVMRICEFLNVPYEEKMLELYTSNPIVYKTEGVSDDLSNEIERWHKRSNLPIENDRINMWGALDKKSLEILETFCGETGELFGYKKSVQISKFRQIQIRLLFLPKILIGIIFLGLKKAMYRLPFKLQKTILGVLRPN